MPVLPEAAQTCFDGYVHGDGQIGPHNWGGSMFGSKPAPCIELSTNKPMFERPVVDMDST